MNPRTFTHRGRFLLLAVFAACILPGSAADWKLAWSDEFDKTGAPDPSKWDYEHGFLRNNEAQFYTRNRRENARIENGRLIIEARRERWKNPDYRAGSSPKAHEVAEYTSASLVTRGKASWTYGKIEVRAKLPAGRGTWPAIWMLGNNIHEVGWPDCGEIDIMEFVGFDPGIVHANIHTKSYNHVLNTAKGAKVKVPDASTSFHVYAVEWTRERLQFSVDGKTYFTFRNEKRGSDTWPFDRDHYLILNLAIGGGWGGQKGIDASVFPQRYEIDYVRVYKKE